MFFTTIPSVITSTVSHIFFQLSVIERMIFETLSNVLEFPFDYIPRGLFIGKRLILGWISLVEMETNFIGLNNDQFSSTKHGILEVALRWRILLLIQLLQLQQHLWVGPHKSPPPDLCNKQMEVRVFLTP